MKNFIASVVTVAAVASGALAQTFQVNTPLNLVQCVPTQVNWVGGTPPYTLLIQTPDANGAIIEQHSGLTSTSFTWGTNFSANQNVGFTVRDQTGTSAQSGQTLINAGTDSSCLTGASTPSSGASSAAGSTSAGSSTPAASTPAGTSSTGAGASSAAPGSSSGTSRPASSGTSSSATTSASATGAANNGALANSAALGMVGVVGAVVAAIIA